MVLLIYVYKLKYYVYDITSQNLNIMLIVLPYYILCDIIIKNKQKILNYKIKTLCHIEKEFRCEFVGDNTSGLVYAYWRLVSPFFFLYIYLYSFFFTRNIFRNRTCGIGLTAKLFFIFRSFPVYLFKGFIFLLFLIFLECRVELFN